MPQNNLEELGFLNKLAGASDDLNMQIHEKEKIIDEKNKKIDLLKKEIISLEEKVKNIDVVFKAEMANKIKNFEQKESEVKNREGILVNLNREAEKYFEKESLKMTEEFKKIKEINISTDKILDKNQNVLKEILAEKELVKNISSLNNSINEEIKQEKIYLSRSKKELEDFRMSINLQENALKELSGEVNKKLKEADEKINSIKVAKMDINNRENEINARIKQEQDLERKNINLLEELKAKLGELEVKDKAYNDKVKQIQIETDNNAKNFVALKVKEITLNEKERDLNEREKNIKILEAKLKGV